jgi:hypothetical protein
LEKIVNSFLATMALLFLASSPFAQTRPERQVKFTSVYTNLKTECRSALTPKEEKESEEMGEDIPSLCRGYGGYQIFLGSHGAITQLQFRTKRDDEVQASETMLYSDPIYMRRVEWRLADGVPFAVIFRRDVYEENDDPMNAKKTGEVLRVIGLKDKRIDFEVDIKKTPNPNQEARRLADRAYAR